MNDKTMSVWGIGPVFVTLSIIIALLLWYVDYVTYPIFYVDFIPSFVFIIISAIFIIFGLTIWIVGGRTIDSYIKKGTLADKGLYGIVRNPIYSGALFVIFGVFTLITHSYLSLVVFIVVYALLRILVKKEEKILTTHFKEDFDIYRKNVNSIIPKLKSFHDAFFYPKESGKVTDNIIAIENKDVNVFVYTDGKNYICIDSGYNGNSIVDELINIGCVVQFNTTV